MNRKCMPNPQHSLSDPSFTTRPVLADGARTLPTSSDGKNDLNDEPGPTDLSLLIANSQVQQVRLSDIRGLSRHIPESCMSGYQRQVPAGSVSNHYIEILASTQCPYLVNSPSTTDGFSFEVVANVRLWTLLARLKNENSEFKITARVFPELTKGEIALFAKSELFTSFHVLFPHRELMSAVLSGLCSAWEKNLIESMVTGLRSKQKIAQEFGFADRSSLAPRNKKAAKGAKND